MFYVLFPIFSEMFLRVMELMLSTSFRLITCSSLFILRYLLRFLVFRKLRRFPSHQAEGGTYAYRPRFKGVWDIGKLPKGLQQMEEVVFLGVPDFSVRPLDGALYLQFLLESSNSVSAINCAFYAFKCVHKVAGLESPTLHPTIIAAKKGALRFVSQSASHRKGTLQVAHLKQLADRADFDNLLELRSLVMLVLAFSSFPRSSELCLMRSKNVQFSSGYVTIFIEKNKTNQLRECWSVIIAETHCSTCPCALVRAYMRKAQIVKNSDEFLFRPITSSRNHKRLVSFSKPISYSVYRDSFKTSFPDIVPNISNFSTHSARSGSATLAANSGVCEENIQRHGRWASVEVKNIYV